MPVFDQEILQMAEAKGPLTDKAYLDARATCLSATRTNGIDALLKAHQLDAIVSLTSGLAWLIDHINGDSGSGGSAMPAAVAGYPHITVPAGLVRGLPVGLSFFASAYSEPTLIRLASGWEAHTKARVPPTFAPSMPL
jgi:amidase